MSALDAWRRWQAAAGPWRGYAVCPSLMCFSPEETHLGTSSTGPSPRVGELGDVENLFAPGPTALVVDLDPRMGVRWAADISRQRLAHVVLVLPRWPHVDAVLPCGELVTVLAATSRWLHDVSAPSVVFVLDGERRKTIAPRSKRDEKVDNRYDITAGDLPNLRTLRAAGIQRIVKLTRAA